MNWTEDFDYGLLDHGALQYLIDYELDGVAKGITARVITHGLDLTEKQLYVFRRDVVDPWLIRTCKCCQAVAEGHELIGFWENDGYCGSCANRMYNEARREGIDNPF